MIDDSIAQPIRKSKWGRLRRGNGIWGRETRGRRFSPGRFMVQWGKHMEEGRTLFKYDNAGQAGVRPLRPQPQSGRMHLGNLRSAPLLAWLAARSRGGRMVLRLEDLDPDRCTQTWCDQVMRDLEWLGLDWDNEPVYQSRRTDAYRAAFSRLENRAHLSLLLHPGGAAGRLRPPPVRRRPRL